MQELSKDQVLLLNELYYDKGLFFGRDKLFRYLQDNHEDANISRRQVDRFLKKQATHMVHQRSKSIRDIKTQVVSQPRLVIQLDLADLQNIEVDGFKYLMVAVDMFSKKTYLEAMKNREKKNIVKAFDGIYKRIKTIKTVRSDNEFRNKPFQTFLQSKKIRSVFGTPRLPQAQGIVERMNSSIKRIISKSILNDDDFNWVQDLNKVEDAINNTFSEATGQTPNSIEKLYDEKKTDEIDEIYEKQRSIKSKQGRLSKAMFNVGDMVRIFDFDPQEQGSAPKFKGRKWSLDTFVVERVNKPKNEYSAFTYKLEGDNKIYKNEELLKIEGDERPADVPKVFAISKLIKPLIAEFNRNGENVSLPAYEVKWKNYKDTTNEPRDVLLKDSPKLIRQFEKKNKVSFKKVNNKFKLSLG